MFGSFKAPVKSSENLMPIAVNPTKASVQKSKKFPNEMTNKEKIPKRNRKTNLENKTSEADRDPQTLDCYVSIGKVLLYNLSSGFFMFIHKSIFPGKNAVA